MNMVLQSRMIILSIIFFLIITYFVRKKKLQIKQSLLWYFTSIVLIAIAVMPKILKTVANWFGIVEITNSIFLVIIGFLLLIVFFNNITISKNQESIAMLIQEISILKSKAEEKNNDIFVSDNSVDNACDRSDSVENGVR